MSHRMADEDLTTDMEKLRFRLRERARVFAASEIAPLDDLHTHERPSE